ncbi:MAG TPA: hypothetical protein VKR59_02230 [Terriglobales bacterium]|nr:hypothetical protein [Terriglobales bacterium]
MRPPIALLPLVVSQLQDSSGDRLVAFTPRKSAKNPFFCPLPSDLAPYSASVDLDPVPDGSYTVFWSFLCGDFGECGLTISQTISVAKGVLVGSAVATIPALPPYGLFILIVLICAALLLGGSFPGPNLTVNRTRRYTA